MLSGSSSRSSRVMGGLFFKNASGVGINVAATVSNLFRQSGSVSPTTLTWSPGLDTFQWSTLATTYPTWASMSGAVVAGGGCWTDITGTPALTGNIDNPVRFAVFPSFGANLVIETNNVDPPRKWDGVAPTFVALGGSPPIARDVTSCFNRVILFNVNEDGVRSGSRLRISEFNNPDVWPPDLVADLTDTNDDGVAIRGLTRSTFLAYKDNSVWIGSGQGGTFPFQIDVLAQDQPGPLSPAVLVSARGAHYFLANDFHLYRATALGVEPISDPVDKEFQSRIRMVNKARAWGAYRSVDHTVWWFFPSTTSADPDQAVSIDLLTGAIHFHRFATPQTAGWSGENVSSLRWRPDLDPFQWNNIAARFPTWTSFGGQETIAEFVGSVDGFVQSFLYDVDDHEVPIDMRWELPPKPWGGPDQDIDFDSVESGFEQVGGGPLVTVEVGRSAALGEADGPEYTEIGQHDTTSTDRQLLSWRSNKALRARFMNLRYRVASSAPVKWKGAVAFASKEEVV